MHSEFCFSKDSPKIQLAVAPRSNYFHNTETVLWYHREFSRNVATDFSLGFRKRMVKYFLKKQNKTKKQPTTHEPEIWLFGKEVGNLNANIGLHALKYGILLSFQMA